MKFSRIQICSLLSFIVIIFLISAVAVYNNYGTIPLSPVTVTSQKINNPQIATQPATSQTTTNKQTAPPSASQSSSAAAPSVEIKPQPVRPVINAPSQLIDLSNWYVTLPTDNDGNGRADEIHQPSLAGFSVAHYFMLNDARNGIIFQAHAGGATTSGSHYPRSELREMADNGTVKAAWSNTSGSHSMTVTEAITHLPSAKPEVVAAQIHDANDDVIMIRLEGRRLFVESDDGKNSGDLDTAYTLGTTFTVRILAENGHIYVSYNGVAKVDLARSGSGFYFKAGCYTQSNTTKGDSGDAYGQVIMYGLSVTHS